MMHNVDDEDGYYGDDDHTSIAQRSKSRRQLAGRKL